jgi:hypothetical protein
MRNKTWCLARASRYNGVADMEADKPLDAAAIVSVDLATVEKATRNFSKRNVIGEGAFIIVYEVCRLFVLCFFCPERRPAHNSNL